MSKESTGPAAKERTLGSRMLHLAFPMAIQSLLTSVVNASDAVMLGALSQNEMAAVSLAGQIAFVHMLFLSSCMIGQSAMAAQYWGKKDKQAVEEITAIAATASAVCSLIFALLALIFPQALMSLYTSDPNLIRSGAIYLRVVSPSYLFLGFSQIYLCTMKNTDRVLKSSIFGTVPVVMNVILNAFFIFGLAGLPKMGIAGAALATVLSRLTELILAAIENGKKRVVRLRLSYMIHIPQKQAKAYFRYTKPVLGNMIAWGGAMTMYSVIMGHLGSDAVAASAAAGIVKNIAGCASSGLGAGTGIIIGNLLGAGKLEEAKKAGTRIMHMSLAVGAVSGALIALTSFMLPFLPLNLTDPAMQFLKIMLIVCGINMVGKTANSTLISGIFTAGGDTRFGFLADLINLWGVILPIAFISAFLFKLPAWLVYCLMNLDEFTKMPFEYRHYRKYGWVTDITEKKEMNEVAKIGVDG